MKYNLPPSECRMSGKPLCMVQEGGMISCAPPSIPVITDWNMLDVDGDDRWTRKEAKDEKLRERIQCKYNVDLLQLYDTLAHQLNQSEALRGRVDSSLFK